MSPPAGVDLAVGIPETARRTVCAARDSRRAATAFFRMSNWPSATRKARPATSHGGRRYRPIRRPATRQVCVQMRVLAAALRRRHKAGQPRLFKIGLDS